MSVLKHIVVSHLLIGMKWIKEWKWRE